MLELFIQLALLVTCTFLFGLLTLRLQLSNAPLRALVQGLLFGLFALVIMLNPIVIADGIIFDLRNVMIAVVAALVGSVPGALVCLIVIVFRLSLGGAGAPLAAGAAVTSLLLGSLLALYRKRHAEHADALLVGLGVALALQSLAWLLLLPAETARAVITTIAVPLLLVSPASCWVLGALLRFQERHRELEAHLSAEHNQLRTLIDNVPDYIFIKDTAKRYVLSNRAHAQAAGVAVPVDLLGCRAEQFFPADYVLQHEQDDAAVLRGERLLAQERQTVNAAGTPIWVSTTKIPLRDLEGRVTGIVGISRDITLSKQAAEEAQRLQAALDRMNEGAQLIDLDWRYLYVNDAAAKQGLRAKADLVGKTMLDVYPGIEHTPLFDVMRRCMEQGVSEHIENEFTFPDNTTGWFDLSLQPMPEGIFILSTDITRRRKAEDALRENEEKLQTIFNLLPMGASLIDASRQIVQMNLALARMLDMTMDDLLLGKYQSRKYIHPDGTPMLASEFPSERAVVEQQAVFDVEIGVIKEDDRTVWTSVSAAPLPRHHGVVVVTADITERKQAEAVLQESERQFRLLAQNSPDVIYIMDLTQQRATYLNRTEFLGYSQKEIEGSGSVLYTLHPDDKDKVLAHWREAIIEGKLNTISMIEYRLQDKTGQWQWVLSRETIFASTPDGKPTQILVTLSVITERKQAEAQAFALAAEQQRGKLLREFVTDISHDFRTPLSIIGSSASLVSKTTDSAKLTRYSQRIEEQISRLALLMDSFVELVHLEQQASALQFQAIDVDELLQTIVERFRSEAQAKRQRLEYITETDSPQVSADPHALTKAIGNIVVNAIRYTPDEGSITLRLCRVGDDLVVAVADTGIGIPAEDLSRIFESFYRVDSARSTDSGGAGLGLTMAKKLVELMKGQIEIESEVGKGSVFKLYLPSVT